MYSPDLSSVLSYVPPDRALSEHVFCIFDYKLTERGIGQGTQT